jgi:hypothetical protein
MGTIVDQNLLLQDQLAALSQTTFGETDPMDEESAGPMNICSGGDAWPAASNSPGGRAISFVDDTKFLFPPLTGFKSQSDAEKLTVRSGARHPPKDAVRHPDDGIKGAALLALAMGTFGGLSDLDAMASAIAALCYDTGNNKEPSKDNDSYNNDYYNTAKLSDGKDWCQPMQLSGLGQGSGVSPSIWHSIQQQVLPISSPTHQNQAQPPSIGNSGSESSSEVLD